MNNNQPINVIVRVRPILPDDKSKQDIVNVNGSVIHLTSPSTEVKIFKFNNVYKSQTKELYDENCFRLLVKAIEGYSTSILCYGVSGSGKTFTMNEIVRTIFKDLFVFLNDNGESYSVSLSYFQIYQENIEDLLNINNKSLKLRGLSKNIEVVGLSECICDNYEDCIKNFDRGFSKRTVAETRINQKSSRSHGVLKITVKTIEKESKNILKTGNMYLVDLAGSERLSKTGAQGMRLEEAKKISLSLFTLRMVLNALAFKQPHVPFRDSKLTRILENSLGGNSLTLFIVNVSPSAYFYQETLDSLIYGDITGKIKNNAKINKDPTSEIIAGLRKEIEDLKKSNEEMEALLVSKREIEIKNLTELSEKPLPKLDQNDQEYLRMRKQDFIDSVRNELDFSSVELEILKSNFNGFEKMLTENKIINKDVFELLKKLEEKNKYQEYRIYDLVQNMQNEKDNYENEILEIKNAHMKQIQNEKDNYENENEILETKNALMKQMQKEKDASEEKTEQITDNDEIENKYHYDSKLTDVQRDILNSSDSNDLKRKIKNDKSLVKDIYKLIKFQEKIIKENIHLNEASIIIDLINNKNSEVQTDITLPENSHLNTNDINAQLMNSFLLMTEKSNDDILKYKNFADKTLSNNKISPPRTSSICAIL